MKQLRKIFSLAMFVAALLLVPSRAAAQSGSFPVGHATRLLDVTGTRGETRHVNVHLWYPAPDPQNCQSGDGNSQGCPPSVYTSRLHGVPLLPQWDPLSWTIGSTLSFEELPISNAKPSYPVIIFSHGNQNNAIDYVYTLEGLARRGFIVAAPDHVNNTQDDVLIDFINGQANSTVIPCFDGLPSPCSHANLAESMTDRVRDVSAVIDALPTWFGSRADTSRIGVMGHSRGSVTALAAAGGSTTWVTAGNPQGFLPDSRVKAIMGLSIGMPNVTSGVDLPNVRVPTLLLAGLLDIVGPPSVSQFAYNNISSADKTLVKIPNAKHRHFDSGRCAQTQSSGVIAEANPRAILDLQTVTNQLIVPNGGGVAMDYCGPDTFFDTVNNPPTYNIRPLVLSLTGFNFTTTNVPTTGLSSDAVKTEVVKQAVAFFGRAL